jgi:hypothetical protein
VEVPEKALEATLRWITATNAGPFSGPFQVEVMAPKASTGATEVQQARFSLVSAGENNGVPQGFRRLVVESVSRLWMTVLPLPPKPVDKK